MLKDGKWVVWGRFLTPRPALSSEIALFAPQGRHGTVGDSPAGQLVIDPFNFRILFFLFFFFCFCFSFQSELIDLEWLTTLRHQDIVWEDGMKQKSLILIMGFGWLDKTAPDTRLIARLNGRIAIRLTPNEVNTWGYPPLFCHPYLRCTGVWNNLDRDSRTNLRANSNTPRYTKKNGKIPEQKLVWRLC